MERKSRLVSIDGQPLTVVVPREFKKTVRDGTEHTRQGYYSQQRTVIDGRPATVQVLIYHDAEFDTAE